MYRHDSTGVLWIHTARPALTPHVAWALARAGMTLPDGTRPTASLWRARPDDDTRLCAEMEWRGPAGAAARLVDDLSRWPDLTFEVTEDPDAAIPGAQGERHCHVPALGTWSGVTDAAGDVQIGEQRLRAIMAAHRGDAAGLARALDAELGTAWDAALEPLRPGTAGFEPWEPAGAVPEGNVLDDAPVSPDAPDTTTGPAGGEAEPVACDVVELPARRAVM
ncbi:DUF3145 family protein [uncultured Corynebacterium sp.]|uniref:DUF3145 family protein n=1 Tax=uncultured Corynebacterium sp. TaxID=159447 RepID=UPI0025F2A7FB|nr:DUF3145 family protein [uncultured Corynebacterium sp.]